jgi:hypothetical protein
MTWKLVEAYEDGTPATPWWEIRGKECLIWMESRLGNDRGNWVAQVSVDRNHELALSLDHQDGWPRYYFDLARAKAEIEAWLRRRGQWVDP